MRNYLAAALMLAVLPLLHRSQLAAQDGGFVVRLGTDTLAVERFTRTASRLEGEVIARSPRLVRRVYVIEFGSDGNPVRAELTSRAPGAPAGAAPLARVVATFGRDTVVVEAWRETGSRILRAAVPAGAVPVVGDGWAGYDLMGARARRSRADSLRFHVYQIGAPSPGWVEFKRSGRDSFVLADQFLVHRARFDAQGRLLGAARPEQRFTVERVRSADLAAIAAAWADRERRAGAMGALSPRDTVRAGVAGAGITIDYSRPSRRGRVIFGGVVPWNEVWRTGANAATRLITDRDLEIGGARLGAGAYSLWTIPSPAGWKLIINSEADVAGTARDPAHDLHHLDMTVAALPQPVEQFTITVTPEGQGGVLRLRWDATEASIPFTVGRHQRP